MSAKDKGELVPQGGGDPIPLVRENLTLGRRSSNDICLDFPNISGKHCGLTYKSGHWIIADLNSTNGIKVNGVRVTKKVLRSDDVITIGKRKYVIKYTPVGEMDDFEEQEAAGMGGSLLEKAGLGGKRGLASFGPDEEDDDDDDDDDF